MRMHLDSIPKKFYEVNDLDKRSLIRLLLTYEKDFFCETTELILIKFHTQPLGKGLKKMYLIGPGHITKMVVKPKYGNNLKDLFILNCWADGLEKIGKLMGITGVELKDKIHVSVYLMIVSYQLVMLVCFEI